MRGWTDNLAEVIKNLYFLLYTSNHGLKSESFKRSAESYIESFINNEIKLSGYTPKLLLLKRMIS